MALATITPKGGHSGGVAIAWRPWIPVTGHPTILHTIRCITIPVLIHGLGPTVLGSVYGIVDGPAMQQELLVRDIQHALRTDGRPYITGGDWNVQPQVMRQWRQDGMQTWHIAAPLATNMHHTTSHIYPRLLLHRPKGEPSPRASTGRSGRGGKAPPGGNDHPH